MTLDPLTISLLAAIGSLSTAIVSLWRKNEALHNARRDDQAKASKLIFALLQKRHAERGEQSPATVSEWDDEPNTQVAMKQFQEATSHATNELNGNWEKLVKQYLSNSSPPKSE